MEGVVQPKHIGSTFFPAFQFVTNVNIEPTVTYIC